jgi:putative hydrolase of the HAD superfamily
VVAADPSLERQRVTTPIDPGSYDAVLLDVGGVLVLPDPTVIAPLLEYYGATADVHTHHRAHYAAMASKSRAGVGEVDWDEFDRAYVTHVGVSGDDVAEAAFVLGRTRTAHLWRWPIASSVEAVHALHARGVPLGIVSNATGQVEAMLRRLGICQVGEGVGATVCCVVDSHVVGVAKPDPAIFDHALVHLDGVRRERVVYVGDSVTMDVGGARAAGLRPILLDPHDDHRGADFERIGSLLDLLG